MHDLCTMRGAANPFLRFKRRRERELRRRFTYREMADQLGISEDLARKLGCESVTSVSPKLAKQFEERSDGAIRYLDVMRWVERHLDAPASGAAAAGGR